MSRLLHGTNASYLIMMICRLRARVSECNDAGPGEASELFETIVPDLGDHSVQGNLLRVPECKLVPSPKHNRPNIHLNAWNKAYEYKITIFIWMQNIFPWCMVACNRFNIYLNVKHISLRGNYGGITGNIFELRGNYGGITSFIFYGNSCLKRKFLSSTWSRPQVRF